jgi:hypothetical protein
MLIKFNFNDKTISGKLNMIASGDKSHLDNTVEIRNFRGLKSAVFFGASGKLYFLSKISAMKNAVLFNQISPGNFEILFKKNDDLFEYKYCVAPGLKITCEELRCYKSSKYQTWFKRYLNKENKYDWQFSKKFRGENVFYKKNTSECDLFLYKAWFLKCQQLNPIFDWFDDLFCFNNPIQPECFFDDALNNGSCLIVDNAMNNYHPNLAKFIVKKFHDRELNKNGAQLIFTTHNTSLLDLELFRRDQIWFAEKDKDQKIDIYSLSDFKDVRKHKDIEKAYLLGVYGGVPYIDETVLSS